MIMEKTKKTKYFLLSVILILFILISVFSLYQIKKEASVKYVRNIPGSMMAITIPPFGIFIEEKYINEGEDNGSILAHERIHWLQYQEFGLIKFYFKYLSGWIINGRIYNELEKDARARSK